MLKEVDMDELGEYMTSPVVKIDAEATVNEAAEIMQTNNIGSLIITKLGDDVGIITERDLTQKVLALKKSPENVSVEEIMTSPILSMDRYFPVEEANEFMRKHKIRHLAVTEENTIVGLISVSNLVAYFSKSFRMQE